MATVKHSYTFSSLAPFILIFKENIIHVCKHNLVFPCVLTQLLVKCILEEDMVEVSGGGLGYVYSTLQFHFHWGSESHDSGGSEHTVDSKRYPMEVVK